MSMTKYRVAMLLHTLFLVKEQAVYKQQWYVKGVKYRLSKPLFECIDSRPVDHRLVHRMPNMLAC